MTAEEMTSEEMTEKEMISREEDIPNPPDPENDTAGMAKETAEEQIKKDRRIYVLSEEKPVKAVIRLGVPLIAGMFIMVFYNMVDTFFIGLMRDDYQLAAVNLAYPVMMISIAISNIVGTGASSLIARSLGAKRMDRACRTLTAGFELTVVNSLAVTCLGMAFLPAIVKGLGAQSNTFLYTEQYTRIIILGSLFTMGNYTSGQLLRSEGSVKYSVLGMIAGTLVNIVLDPVFIFALGLEIRGAAIATILGNAAGMAISLWLYAGGKTLLKPSLRFLKPEGKILAEIYWVGIPASLETMLTSAAYIELQEDEGSVEGGHHGRQRYGTLCHGFLRTGSAAADRHLYGLTRSDRHGQQSAAHHHVYPSVCGRGLHEQDVLSGNGKTAICFCDHTGASAGALCAAFAAAEPDIRFRRNDLGTARDRDDHDGRIGITSSGDDHEGRQAETTGRENCITLFLLFSLISTVYCFSMKTQFIVSL